MAKVYTDKNVLDATLERLEYIFNEFDNVLVAFSGGKDSGILFNLTYDYAKKHNMLNKLAVYFEDYEGGYQYTVDFVKRTFDKYTDIKRYWLCLPIRAACSVSMHQSYWIPWNKDEEEIWIREYPKGDYVITEDNCPFKFEKGTSGFETRIIFSKWYASQNGKTAVFVGLRADESLSRLSAITSKHRSKMYKEKRYSKKVNEDTFNFYPIYDWTTEDVWVANYKYAFDYNKLYDLYYQAGLSISQMRTASPFHQCGQNSLKLYKVIEPKTWGKMVSRVNGVNFTGLYGGTTAMGWKNIKKPSHFTWKQYAEFLIETLPKDAKARMLYNLDRIQWTWKNKGYGRNPRVIATMEKEGIILEKTGETSKICTKDDVYEIVKMKSDMPDDTSIPDFRHCPNWKGVCITILKNDFTCQYMGCSRTKTDMLKRKSAINKYKNIMRGRDA